MKDDLRKRLGALTPAQRELLERRVAAQRRAATGADLAPQEGPGPFPLSWSQERFWFLERLEPANPAHHVPGIAMFHGPLDTEAFRAALQLLVQRHAILRTVYEETPDGPVQRVLPEVELALELTDLRGLPPSERESERARIEERLLLTAFDLERGPLVRMRLLRLSDDVHQLISCLHHIAADGMTMQLLGEETALAYPELVAGRRPELPPLPVQYADYAAWQRAHLSGPRLERGVQWWSEQLADLAELTLPADRPRVARTDGRHALGRREGLDLPEDLGVALRALARAEGSTLFSVLLAAFQALLHRWTGETDVAVGTTAANRGRSELERLVGFFVNTLVLRTDLGGDPTFRELVKRTSRSSLAAQDHQDVPFERVVDALQPERSLEKHPLFQVMFNYVEFQGWTRPLGAGVAMEYRLAQAGTLFDLTLYATVHGDRVRLDFEYAHDLFDAATVRRLLSHLETFLFGAVLEPDRRVSQAAILPPEERLRLSRWGVGAPRVDDAPLLLHERFAARAAQHPERVAVRDDAGSMTYGEVERVAARIAADLAAGGTRPGDRVGVALERGVGIVPALLGVARAGASWVPLDPAQPEARRALIRDDAGIVKTLEAADLERALQPGVAEPPALSIDPESCAYVLYTSGSTGVPKGVRVPHRALVSFLDAVAGTPGLGENDALLAVTTLGFDISLLELFAPLLVGGRVFVASAEDAADGKRLARLIERARPTVMQATPAMWRMLHLSGWRGIDGERGLRAFCGGEAMPRDLADDLLDCTDELWNLYGPTETTVWSAVDRVSSAPIAIGRPLVGESLHVLDPHGNEAPIGVPGDLWIAGSGVALGYTDAALDAGRFEPLPGREAGAGRAYRTGDRAKWRADGRLAFLGRDDDQIKLRGFRIELGDVEAALRAHAKVADAACALRGERLCAWFVPADAQDAPDAAELAAHVGARCPEYMVPAAFTAVDAVPLSPAGKVDRRAWPDPRATPRQSAAAAANDTERALQEIWAEALGIGSVGTGEDFFELGGHSLLAARLASRIALRLGAELPLQLFFSHPTIAALAPEVDRARSRASAVDARPIFVGPRPPRIPLTFHQERLWFLDALAEGPSAYHMPGAVRLSGPLDVEALARALTEVVRRHEVLRTNLVAGPGGTPEQVVRPPAPFELERADFAAAADPESAWRALARAFIAQPFDFAEGSLLRACLVRTSARAPESHVLVVCMHHVVSDGWSLGVLIGEVRELYAAFRSGAPSPLRELPLQIADLAVWQRAQLSGARLERELRWWIDAMDGAPARLDLPTDHPRPAMPSHSGRRIHVALGEQRAGALRELARARSASTFHALLAALQVLFARLAGAEEIVIGTSVAGRTRPETEELIGFLVNAVPLFGRVDLDAPFEAQLAHARDVALAAQEHADLPFERLVEALRPPRDLSRQPVFQVTLDLDNVPTPPAELAGLEVEEIALDTDRAKFDLSVLARDDAELSCTLEFADDLFTEATVRAWWRSLELLLDAAIAAPETPSGALPLLDDDARTAALASLAGPAPADAPETLLALVDGATWPTGAVAVRGPKFELTPEALATRANAVAAMLVERGVEPGDRVGVCLGHVPDLVPALLGVLRARAAYVPLDPAYPAARIERIVRDAACALTLTDARSASSLPESVDRIHLDESPHPGNRDHAPTVDVDADDIAYVLYTSGSTGTPKGVEVSHGAAARYVESARALYRVEDGDGAPLASSIGFDLTITSLFPVLAAGRTVTLAGDARRGVEALAETARSRATGKPFSLVKLTPAHLRALAHELSPEEARGWTNVLVVGGEALDHADLAFWQEHAPDTRIVNEYGPTEATVGCVVHEVGGAEPRRAGPVPIGRPLPGMRAYVLDARREPVPRGAPGELWVAGPQLARGYHDDPALTAERFVRDPFDLGAPGAPGAPGESGARMYRTGDVVRQRPDGALVYVGRTDAQLKVRGVRVEPAEIEAALRRAGADEAAIGVRADRLIAWVVPAAGADVAAMRAAVRVDLPDAFVPSAVLAVDTIPLTAHGKVDIAALPSPGADVDGQVERVTEPARGADESALASAFAQALGLEPAAVGRDDDFFALGGDSILALSVVVRAAESRLFLRPRDVFEHPTVARLATVASPTRHASVAVEGPIEGEVPLLPAQRWLLGMGLAQVEHWNQALALEVAPGITPRLLQSAIATLVEYHDALRTTFDRDVDGTWRARVVPTLDAAHARRSCDGAAPDAASLDACHAGFDLTRGPIQRVTWFDRAEGAPLVVWSIHHLVVDAVSWRILLEDLSRVVHALLDGREPTLPPKSASVRAFADAIEVDARPAVDEVELDPGPEQAAATIELRLDADSVLASPLRTLRAGPEEVLVTGLARVVGGSHAIDVESHGRRGADDALDLSRTVGWFTSIRSVATTTLGAEADPVARLKHVKEALAAERQTPGVRAAGAVLFNFLGRIGEAPSDAAVAPIDLDVGAVRHGRNRRTHLLEVNARLVGGELVVALTAAPSALRHLGGTDDLRSFADAVGQSVREVAEACKAPEVARLTPSDVPLSGLDQAELDALGPGIEDVLPLTPTQQGMVFHALRAPGNAAYLEQLANVLEGDLEHRALRAAFETLTADVELLRARIAWRGFAEPLLLVATPEAFGAVPWREVDWRDRGADEALADLRALCEEERRLGIDLERGPLYRIVLARMPAGRNAIVWTYHHVILDGWSMPQVLKRVLDVYLAAREGTAGRPPALPPWRDYLAWLAQRDHEEARAFWTARLSGFSQRTAIGPRACAGDDTESGTFGETELFLDRAETARLVALARGRGVTLSTLAQAAWALVLARTSGERDVLFGATVAGRPPELDRIDERVGLFINTLPVRVEVDDEARVDAWLRDLQMRRAEEMAFEWTPLPLSQAASDVPRGTPVFDSLVVFENYPLDDALRAPPGGLRVVETLAYERTSYAATLVCVPGASLTLRLLFDEGRFTGEEACRLVGSVRAALTGLAAASESGRVGEVGVLAEDERQELLFRLPHGAAAPSPSDGSFVSIGEAILARAAASADDIALEQGETRWTYAQLADRVETLGARLAEHGVAPGDVVGVQLPRSPDFVAALLAVWRTGGVFLPLDPAHPAARRAFQVEDAGARTVLSSRAVADDGSGCVWVEDAPSSGEAAAAWTATPEDAAYVLYTSGSSGSPKGVVVSHGSITHYARVAARAYAVTRDDRALQLAALGFDTSLEEILPTLASGATLVLRQDDDLASPKAFARMVRERAITLLNFPTALWHELALGFDAEDASNLRDVRGVILGGEALLPGPLARWNELGLDRVTLWNTYGPTEATIVATMHTLGADDVGGERAAAPPIGRPIEGARAFVVDDDLRLVPRGYPGELVLGGAGIATGYLGHAAGENPRAFPPDVFPGSRSSTARLYRTGDRVAWTEDGALAYIGRADDQVKVRGHRIELAEVERALTRIPGVARAAAVVRRDARGRATLFAWVVPSETPVAGEVVLQALAEQVPAAMVPAQVHPVTELPRTARGKLDRERLLASLDPNAIDAPADSPAGSPADSNEPPRNEDEARVCELFAEALDLPAVGRTDDFFALGGDSLVAVRFLGLFGAAFDVELPLRDLFDGPTPAELAVTLAAIRGAADLDALRRAREIDLASEAVLPEDVRPASKTPSAPPRSVLLTGATGFLGAHLIPTLLDRLGEEARVVALVRGSDDAAARARLLDVLARYELPCDASRIDVRAADLAAPRLGLDARTFDELGAEVDAIVHAGAEVSFLKTYAALKPANVGGTIELLRLAGVGRAKSFHHVSTVGVFDVDAPPRELFEDADLSDFAAVRGGYAQSKWVAEQIVGAAGARGLATTVYRPGRLVASSRTGVANPGDVAHELLRACITLGAVPDLPVRTDATPIDHAALVIAHVVATRAAENETYHVVHEAELEGEAAAAALRAAGCAVERIDPALWWRKLRARAASGTDTGLAMLAPLLGALPELRGETGEPASRLDDARTRDAIQGVLSPPTLDAAYLRRVAARLVDADSDA